MIRDRIKSAAKKAAVKFFKMDWEAEHVAEGSQHVKTAPPAYVDPNVIPRVVDGSGDTPGPNHRTNIGRTWLAAQVASDASPYMIDIRTPAECAGGILKGALVFPGEQIKDRLDRLPEKAVRITVYDQTGSDRADALAEWLRGQGWDMARRLVGGYAEWIEHAEPITQPQPPDGARYGVGRQVQRKDGSRAWVQEVRMDGGSARYTLWSADGSWKAGVGEDELAG